MQLERETDSHEEASSHFSQICLKKVATPPPNSQPFNYNYFNLIPRPQKSAGCNAKMLVFRNR